MKETSQPRLATPSCHFEGYGVSKDVTDDGPAIIILEGRHNEIHMRKPAA